MGKLRAFYLCSTLRSDSSTEFLNARVGETLSGKETSTYKMLEEVLVKIARSRRSRLLQHGERSPMCLPFIVPSVHIFIAPSYYSVVFYLLPEHEEIMTCTYKYVGSPIRDLNITPKP